MKFAPGIKSEKLIKALKVATAILFAFCNIAAAQNVKQEEEKPYLIGPGDEITVKVLGEPQFDFVANVDADGRLEIPFFDQPVSAMCKSERELRADVSKLLTKYLKYPQVSLRVTARNSRPKVSIFGEVRQQQQVELTRRANLLDLISFAGGVTEKAGGMVQIFRTRPPICGEGGPENNWGPTGEGLSAASRMYSLAALRQGRAEANPEIIPGDIIVVQKASPVYVTGEVVRPGELTIPEGGLPLSQAIAMASGITRDAKTKNVKIYRRKAGSSEPEIITVNYEAIRKGEQADPMLIPFDIVEVDKSKKSIGDILLEAVTGIPNRIPIPIRPY